MGKRRKTRSKPSSAPRKRIANSTTEPSVSPHPAVLPVARTSPAPAAKRLGPKTAAGSSTATPGSNVRSVVLSSIALIGGFVPWLFDPPIYAKVLISLTSVALIGAISFSRRSRKVFFVVAAICALLIPVISVISQPSEGQRNVAALWSETYNANIWIRNPVMFEDSKTWLADNYDLIYKSTDRWKSPPTNGAATVPDLITNAGVLQGKAILSVGEIGGFNQLTDSETLVQLISPRAGIMDAGASARDEVAKLGWPYAADLDRFASDTRAPADKVTGVVYCRLQNDPFTAIGHGDTIAVKGVVVASGRTENRSTGQPLDVTYMYCFEWRRLEQLDTRPTPTPTATPTATPTPLPTRSAG